MGRRRDSLAWWVACAGAFLFPAGVANAAAGFLPAETLPASGSAGSGMQTVMAPNGFAIAGWLETVDSTHTAIRVATRPPGGQWSAPQQLDLTSLVQFRYPLSMAIDNAGDAVIAWDDEQLGSPTVDTAVVATKPAAGSVFGTPQKLTGAADPVVGIDATGHVTMVDDELDGASHDLVDRVWPVGGAAPAIRTDAVATGCRPDGARSVFAEAPNGSAIAGAQCGGDTFIRRVGGPWKSPSRPISDSSSGGCPTSPPTSIQGEDMTVAIDAAGDAAGAFVESTSSETDCLTALPTNTTMLQLVVGTPPGGVASAGTVETAVSNDFTTGTSISAPDIAVGPGKILLAWTNAGLTGGADNVRPFDAGGSPTAPAQPLVTGGVGGFLAPAQVALSAGGGALAVFPTHDATAVQAAVRAPGAAAFSAPVPLAASPSAAPGVAIDDAGDGVAVYDFGGTKAVAQARGFDATPPVLGAASIPPVSPSGKRVSFTAGALDFWGPTTLSWNFGDGSAAASGSPVAHVFSRTGTHRVTVTATDAVGNTAQRSGSISIFTPTPVLSRASIKPKRFKVGHTAVFSFTLNQAARVTIALGRRYVPRHKRGKHPKPRFAATGTLTTSGKAGVNHLRFAGRVGKRKLKAGTYRATITATTGRIKSKAVTLRFTITRPR